MVGMALSLCHPCYLRIDYHRLVHQASLHSVRNTELGVEGCSEGRSQTPSTEERTKLRPNWERDAANYRGTESGQRRPSVSPSVHLSVCPVLLVKELPIKSLNIHFLVSALP